MSALIRGLIEFSVSAIPHSAFYAPCNQIRHICGGFPAVIEPVTNKKKMLRVFITARKFIYMVLSRNVVLNH